MKTMSMRHTIILSLVSLLLASCNQDQVDVTLYGSVYDQSTRQPISNAVIKIENASYAGGDYDSYEPV